MSEEIDMFVAHSVAKREHKGQKYGEKDYFEHHILGVCRACRYLWGSNSRLQTIAYLHDILEDTNYTGEELYQTFGSEVYYAVSCLTRNKGEPYGRYLDKIYDNPLAAKVKVADALFNMLECAKEGDTERAKHYLRNMEKIYMYSGVGANE